MKRSCVYVCASSCIKRYVQPFIWLPWDARGCLYMCLYCARVSTLHCALENGADLYVNENQKIRHYRARSNEDRRRKRGRMSNRDFFYFPRCVCKLRYYSDAIH